MASFCFASSYSSYAALKCSIWDAQFSISHVIYDIVSFCSIFVLKSVIVPALEWILPGHCPQINSPESCSFSSILEFYRFLRGGLVQLFNVSIYPS